MTEKKLEQETIDSEIYEPRNLKQAKYLYSIKANIHGLEDMNLNPAIDSDFLNTLMEMPT